MVLCARLVYGAGAQTTTPRNIGTVSGEPDAVIPHVRFCRGSRPKRNSLKTAKPRGRVLPTRQGNRTTTPCTPAHYGQDASVWLGDRGDRIGEVLRGAVRDPVVGCRSDTRRVYAESHLTPFDFYAQVLDAFGVGVPFQRTQARRQFITLMTDLYQHQGKQPLIVIDEAQSLPQTMIQELRFVLLCRIAGYAV